MRWLVYLLLLMSIASAAGNDVFIAIFPFAVVIVAVILGLLNMAAETFSLPMLSAYVKTELGELVSGVVLAVIVYAFIIGSNQLTTILVGKSATDLAAAHFQSLISDYYFKTYMGIIRISTQLRAMVSFNTQQVWPAAYISWGHSIGPYAGIAPFLTSLSMAVQGIANNILIYETLLLLLSFSNSVIGPIVLPIALALRLIPFTRQAGTALIAICISLLVIYPWSVVFVSEIHKVVHYPNPTDNGAVNNILSNMGVHFPAIDVLETMCQNFVIRGFLELNELGNVILFCPLTCGLACAGPQFAVCFPACFETCFALIVFLIYPLVSAGAQLIYNTLGTYFLMHADYQQAGAIFDAMYPFVRDINNMVVMGYVDALIIGVFTIVGSRSVSAALGGEWYMLRFQRLI